MTPLDILTLIAQLATTISVIIAVISIRAETIAIRRQMNAQAFIAYTERLERIMDSLPDGAYTSRFDAENLPTESAKLTTAIIKYIAMAQQIFYLSKHEYIDEEVWKVWEYEIKDNLRSPLFMREWPKISREFKSYPEFLVFIEEARQG